MTSYDDPVVSRVLHDVHHLRSKRSFTSLCTGSQHGHSPSSPSTHNVAPLIRQVVWALRKLSKLSTSVASAPPEKPTATLTEDKFLTLNNTPLPVGVAPPCPPLSESDPSLKAELALLGEHCMLHQESLPDIISVVRRVLQPEQTAKWLVTVWVGHTRCRCRVVLSNTEAFLSKCAPRSHATSAINTDPCQLMSQIDEAKALEVAAWIHQAVSGGSGCLDGALLATITSVLLLWTKSVGQKDGTASLTTFWGAIGVPSPTKADKESVTLVLATAIKAVLQSYAMSLHCGSKHPNATIADARASSARWSRFVAATASDLIDPCAAALLVESIDSFSKALASLP